MNNTIPIMGGIFLALAFAVTALYNWPQGAGFLAPALVCAGVAIYYLVTKPKV